MAGGLCYSISGISIHIYKGKYTLVPKTNFWSRNADFWIVILTLWKSVLEDFRPDCVFFFRITEARIIESRNSHPNKI